jgi:Fe2+ transport system protein B
MLAIDQRVFYRLAGYIILMNIIGLVMMVGGLFIMFFSLFWLGGGLIWLVALIIGALISGAGWMVLFSKGWWPVTKRKNKKSGF